VTSGQSLVHAAAEQLRPLLLRCTFAPAGTPVACALSAGADSTALVALAVAAGCDVTAVHVDHGLRVESPAEAEAAALTCDALGVPLRTVRVDVRDGPNLEARARAARYAALPPDVLTGHTADDQAETVLLNMLRGATTGLGAMRPGLRRPLLALRRTDTEHVCAALGLAVVHDSSNRDPRFLRNRVRHEVLPQLAELAGRDVVPILTRQADLLRDDHDLLDGLAAALDPTDARALASAPPPLARRAVRRWLTAVGDSGHPPDLATVDRVLAVARGAMVACEIAGGRRVQRHHQRLSIVAGSSRVP
jgi:tRNA(Ile)-lysidine synthase